MILKALFGRPEPPPMTTIADLRQAIEGLPDDMPVFVLRAGPTDGWVYFSPRKGAMRSMRLVYGSRGWVREGEGRGETVSAFVVGMT